MTAIADNVESRHVAEEALLLDLELIREKLADRPEAMAKATKRLAEEAWNLICEDPPTPEPTGPQPMTDEQAIRFENREMPWGKHQGLLVGRVPVDYLCYLVENRKPDFVDEINRYLMSPKMQRAQEED